MTQEFEARVLGPTQQIAVQRLQAVDEQDARRQLQAQGLQALSLRTLGGRALHRTPGRQARATLLLVEELQALLEAGLGIPEALDLLAPRAPDQATRGLLRALRQALAEGQLLSRALQMQGFAPLLVGMVRAAEGHGEVPQALARYVAHERRLDQVRQQLVTALTYPALLLLAGGGVSLFLLTYVVPRFAAVYDAGGRSLPWASALLLNWGQFAAAHAGWLLGGLLGLVLLLGGLVRRRWQAQGWLALLRLMPGLGARLALLELARVYLTLGLLLQGGLPLRQALALLEETAGDPGRAMALQAVQQAVLQGQPLSAALQAHQLATPVALRLVLVGERTGQLGELLSRAARFHEGEVARWMDRLVKLLEPALMLGMGLVIGGIVVLLYLPVFELAGNLQ